jgi:hypothetical protein
VDVCGSGCSALSVLETDCSGAVNGAGWTIVEVGVTSEFATRLRRADRAVKIEAVLADTLDGL